MRKLLNKSSVSFIGNFLIFLVVSIGILVSVSVYAEASGVDVAAFVGGIFSY